MRTSVPLLLVAILIAAPAARAQTLADRLLLELTVSGELFDNFFQAPDGVPQETVTAASVEARVGARVSEERPLTIYARFGRTDYEEFDPSTLLGAGLLLDSRRHELDLSLARETDRPTREVGDSIEPADVFLLAAQYGYRVTRDWELRALGDYRDVDFERSMSQNGSLAMGGGAIRYRGWGYDFSPEVGSMWGRRDAQDDEEDHDQRDLYVQVRMIPVQRLYLSFRYRYRTRDYDTEIVTSENFGREDTRHQVVGLADVALADHVSTIVYYAFEDAESTLPTRVFTTQLLTLGLRFRL